MKCGGRYECTRIHKRFALSYTSLSLQPAICNPDIFVKSFFVSVSTKAVVQYSVNDHYNSEDFSLAVSSSADANVCGASRINVCTSYLPKRQSNLIAVEVALVSGYTPFKDDLEALVSSGNGAFTEYEIKGNKVVLYMASLSAEEACADFGVVRELEVEEAKPGVVVVYDYYQPEIAKSKVSHVKNQ